MRSTSTRRSTVLQRHLDCASERSEPTTLTTLTEVLSMAPGLRQLGPRPRASRHAAALVLLGVAAGLLLALTVHSALRLRNTPRMFRSMPVVSSHDQHTSAGATATPTPHACRDAAFDAGPPAGCLQQALWDKCSQPYMKDCALSCNRCVSTERARALSSVLLVSARQPDACAAPDGDLWAMRAMENHNEFARAHALRLSWSSSLLAPSWEGAWNKIVYLRALMRDTLRKRVMPLAAGGGTVEWLLWADWDVVFLDLSTQLPLEEYEARGFNLVLAGDPAAVAEGDYLKLNTGVMLLRVCKWSLALLNLVLDRGRRRSRRDNAASAQSMVKNLCAGCLDDQAVLLLLLRENASQWLAPTFFERRFPMQTYWEDLEGALPPSSRLADDKDIAAAAAFPTAAAALMPLPLAAPGSQPLPPLLRPVFGNHRVPLAVHFAGCQLCSGKGSKLPENTASRCWPSFQAAIRFAAEQTARSLGGAVGGVGSAAVGTLRASAVPIPRARESRPVENRKMHAGARGGGARGGGRAGGGSRRWRAGMGRGRRPERPATHTLER